MLNIDPIRLEHRAKTLAQKTGGEIIQTTARVGGGALPLLNLTGPAIALPYHGNPDRLAKALRNHNPPLLTRIHNNQVLVDPRTLPDNALNTATNIIRHITNELTGKHTENAASRSGPRQTTGHKRTTSALSNHGRAGAQP